VVTEVPFESDFMRNKMRRLTREILSPEERLMRNDPVVRDIIVQNRRRKRAMAAVTRAQLERMMGGGNFIYTFEEATGEIAPSSRWERLSLKDPRIAKKVLAEEAKDLTNRIKDFKESGMSEKSINELQEKLNANRKLQEKYRSDAKAGRRRAPKGRYIGMETPLLSERGENKSRTARREQLLAVKEVEMTEVQRKRGLPVWDEKRKRYVNPKKLDAPLRTIDESGAAIREFTDKEIQEQVVGRKSAKPKTFDRVEGSIVRKSGRKEFRVLVDDVYDSKLTATVRDIVEKKPQTLVNIDKKTGEVVTKSVIRVGNKQVPIEVFRQAYRSLPKERATAAAKILAKVGSRFLGPLGIALTVADVVGLLAKAQAKENT
jgi:hypothetical protein